MTPGCPALETGRHRAHRRRAQAGGGSGGGREPHTNAGACHGYRTRVTVRLRHPQRAVHAPAISTPSCWWARRARAHHRCQLPASFCRGDRSTSSTCSGGHQHFGATDFWAGSPPDRTPGSYALSCASWPPRSRPASRPRSRRAWCCEAAAGGRGRSSTAATLGAPRCRRRRRPWRRRVHGRRGRGHGASAGAHARR